VTNIIRFLFLFGFLARLLAAEPEDLEEVYFQSCVKETKQILIPNFPYAFNPSLIRWKGRYLMSFRAGKGYTYQDEPPGEILPCDPESLRSSRDTDAPAYSPNRFGLVWLDHEFNLISKPQLLDVPNDNPTYRQQDPRLVVVGGHAYIVYSDVVPGTLIEQTRRVVVAELFFEEGVFFVKDVECLNEFEGMSDQRWEKNWVPFDFEENLLMGYSINPHVILYPLLRSGVCCTVASTSATIDWPWGELRGGTPALLVDGEYLAFFHSSNAMFSKQSRGKKAQHYFMGAYTFSAQPPFELTRISPSPIVGKNFYNGKAYQTWKPYLQVVFPGGIVADKTSIYVAYGRQDHEIWIARLDKEELYKSMIPVNSKTR
jgi:predicted GH43/DUF377 family glycosyl hydrolase